MYLICDISWICMLIIFYNHVVIKKIKVPGTFYNNLALIRGLTRDLSFYFHDSNIVANCTHNLFTGLHPKAGSVCF